MYCSKPHLLRCAPRAFFLRERSIAFAVTVNWIIFNNTFSSAELEFAIQIMNRQERVQNRCLLNGKRITILTETKWYWFVCSVQKRMMAMEMRSSQELMKWPWEAISVEKTRRLMVSWGSLITLRRSLYRFISLKHLKSERNNYLL